MWRNMSCGEIFPHDRISTWAMRNLEQICYVEKFLHMTLFCCKISFVAIYAVLSRFTRLCVEKNWTQNCACGEKKTNIRYVYKIVFVICSMLAKFVQLEIIWINWRIISLVALLSLFSRVRHNVASKMSSLIGGIVAFCAPLHLLPGVGEQVSFQIFGLTEGLFALWTVVVLLSIMCWNMYLETISSNSWISALCASVLFLPSVGE